MYVLAAIAINEVRLRRTSHDCCYGPSCEGLRPSCMVLITIRLSEPFASHDAHMPQLFNRQSIMYRVRSGKLQINVCR